MNRWNSHLPFATLLISFLILGAACSGMDGHGTATEPSGMTPPGQNAPSLQNTIPGTAGISGSGIQIAPNPLISREKPVFASDNSGHVEVVNGGRYCVNPAWKTNRFPTWLAIKVGEGPTRLLLNWSNDYTTDYIDHRGTETYGIPSNYTIAVSADSTNGEDGSWQTVVDVQNNDARTREHAFDFAGNQWVKMTVTGIIPGTAGGALGIDQLDIHDASSGTTDSVFFMGDSITAGVYLRCPDLQPSYAQTIHDTFPAFFPVMIDGGVGGVTASYGADNIDQWLDLNPDMHIWAIAYGTNDAWQSLSPEIFEQQLQQIIDTLKAANRVPVLARIPYAVRGPTDTNIQALNQVIDRLTTQDGLHPGPDLYTWFRTHTNELRADGVHPNATGAASINRLWAEALSPLYAGSPAVGDTSQVAMVCDPAKR